MNRKFLPFPKKGKKYHPSSREEMGLLDRKLFTAEAAWIRSAIFFSGLGGIEFSALRLGREKLETKSLKILFILSRRMNEGAGPF